MEGIEFASELPADVELCLALGGDGTILRALRRYAGTDVPVFGINYGTVGFLAAAEGDELAVGLERAFAGDFETGLVLGGRRRPWPSSRACCTPTSGVRPGPGRGRWNSGADEVLEAARPALDELAARRDAELLGRIDEGLGTGGRAAARASSPCSPAVHERRIDTLVVQEGFAAKGVRCPQCGGSGSAPAPSAPPTGP